MNVPPQRAFYFQKKLARVWEIVRLSLSDCQLPIEIDLLIVHLVTAVDAQ